MNNFNIVLIYFILLLFMIKRYIYVYTKNIFSVSINYKLDNIESRKRLEKVFK